MTTSRRLLRSMAAVMAAVTALALPPAASSQDTASTDAPWRPPRPDPGSGSGASAAVITVVGVGLLCLAFCKRDTRQADPMSQRLLRDGPIVEDEYPRGVIVMYGFVRDGWPIVIDYATGEGADVTLSVSVAGRDWTLPLEGGRRQIKFNYEGGAAAKSTPALFVIRSSRWGRDGAEIPQDLELIGFGCGPRAVGSVAINSLRFRPSASPRIGVDYASFGFSASSPFNRLGMEVLRYTGRTEGRTNVIVATPVARYGESARPRGPYGPRIWNGIDQTAGRASSGLHRLRVRAWETGSDRSWVAAISPDAVTMP